MRSKLSRWGVLALTLSVSAGVAAQTSAAPSAVTSAPQSATAHNNSPGASKVPSQATGQTTPARLDQLVSVSIAPPIQRYAGDTTATPDPPLLGRLKLPNKALWLVLEQPPAMHGAPNGTETSAGTVNGSEQAH
jgi:hypothetical protein